VRVGPFELQINAATEFERDARSRVAQHVVARFGEHVRKMHDILENNKNIDCAPFLQDCNEKLSDDLRTHTQSLFKLQSVLSTRKGKVTKITKNKDKQKNVRDLSNQFKTFHAKIYYQSRDYVVKLLGDRESVEMFLPFEEMYGKAVRRHESEGEQNKSVIPFFVRSCYSPQLKFGVGAERTNTILPWVC